MLAKKFVKIFVVISLIFVLGLSMVYVYALGSGNYLYWDFCQDGHTGSCTSGSGVTGDDWTSWVYYTLPDSYGLDWINTTVVDPDGTEQDVGVGGEGRLEDSPYGGGG